MTSTSPRSRQRTQPRVPRAPGRAPTLIGLSAVAVALRVPAFVASNHLTFDDGVFGASAVAMRHGGAPFRDVFSSQGPLFLPLVWLFDLVGLRSDNAPRLLAVASGVAVTLLVYEIGRRLAGHGVGVLAALLATASGSLLWTTGPLAADGPGLALALGAVAVAFSYRDAPAPWKAVVLGALAAAAFAIKSLFAVPPAMVVAWAFLEKGAWRDLAVGVATSGVVLVALAVPWGAADVWDQSVAYHLEAAGDRTPVANAEKVVSTLWDRDLLVLFMGFAAAAVSVLRLTGRLTSPPDEAGEVDGHARAEGGGARTWGGRAAPLAAWAAALGAVYLLEHPLWRPHLSHAVPLLAIAGAYAFRDRLRSGVALAVVLAIAQVASTTGILWPDGYRGEDARAAAALEHLPDGAFAISDDPGFVWRAGLRTPPDLVDTSILRIESERITGPSLARAARDPSVCAVLVWSQRFQRFDLARRLVGDGYERADEFGNGRFLLTRPCPGS